MKKPIAMLLGLALSVQMSGQISTYGADKLAKAKSGTTYFVMPDPNAADAAALKEVFKKNWTISKPEFITYSEIDKHLAKGNSFLCVVLTTVTGKLSDMSRTDGAGRTTTTEGMTTEQKFVDLEFWAPGDKFLESKKTRSEYGGGYKDYIANIAMHCDFATTTTKEDIYTPSYNLFSHLKNWGPGILKNYIQSLNTLLAENEKRGAYQPFKNESELSKLKSATLYAPDYILTKINVFSGDESKKMKDKDVFGDYKYNYQVIPTEDLNAKIQKNESFYYLIFIRNSNHKYVNVVNAATGEIIYSTHDAGAYNMRSNDLKDLYKLIEKG